MANANIVGERSLLGSFFLQQLGLTRANTPPFLCGVEVRAVLFLRYDTGEFMVGYVSTKKSPGICFE